MDSERKRGFEHDDVAIYYIAAVGASYKMSDIEAGQMGGSALV
jgi:hypothetical protein